MVREAYCAVLTFYTIVSAIAVMYEIYVMECVNLAKGLSSYGNE